MKKAVQMMCVAAIVAALGSPASAVDIDTVTVGNPGNTGEQSRNDAVHGWDKTYFGAVDYEYNIGKYEVTNAQYREFLNAVAAVGDANGLYDTDMGGGWNDIGGISRSGSGTGAEPWVYAVRASRAERPVNYVSWYDCLRFANWLHNGQPTGAQVPGTTEDGAYDMTQDFTATGSPVRKPGATWVLAAQDEWYKAAYYKGGGTNAGYWDYPTQSDTAPTSEAPAGSDMANGSANYYDGGYVDTTYCTTEVGTYDAKPSDSAYGTFDQGGNLCEWTEADRWGDGAQRSLRGGSFASHDNGLRASERHYNDPTIGFDSVGFRVAYVPEPATMSLLALGGLALLRRRRGYAA